MSRTVKDRPTKLLWDSYDKDYIYLENFRHILRKTTKPKVRRTKDTEWHWVMATPSWWNHLFHTKPRRRAGRVWESDFINSKIDMWSLEEVDSPSVSNKPHKYYH